MTVHVLLCIDFELEMCMLKSILGTLKVVNVQLHRYTG